MFFLIWLGVLTAANRIYNPEVWVQLLVEFLLSSNYHLDRSRSVGKIRLTQPSDPSVR